MVYFNQNSISYALLDALNKTLFVGNKQVVANQLYLFAQLFGELLPAIPVILSHAIFDRDDRIFLAQACQIIYHLLAGHFYAFAGHLVLAVNIEFAGSNVHRHNDVLARLVASAFSSLENNLDSISIAFQVRSKAALVTQSSGEAFFFQQSLQVMINLGIHAQCFAEGFCTNRHNHEFLNIYVVVCVLAAVQNVHHRHRQLLSSYAAQIQVQRQAYGNSSSLSNSHGYA